MKTKIAIAALIAVLAAVAAVAIVAVVQIRSLQTEQNTLTRQLSRAQHEQLVLRQSERRLGSQVATLNVPSDPLSAYNEVCNQPMQNGATGNTQTFYFPCTNSAQTIPSPGY